MYKLNTIGMKTYNFFELGILYSRYYAAKSSRQMKPDHILEEYEGFVKKLHELNLQNIEKSIIESEEPFDFQGYFVKNGMENKGKAFRMGQLSFAIFLLAPTKNPDAENEIISICEYLKFDHRCFHQFIHEISSAFENAGDQIDKEQWQKAFKKLSIAFGKLVGDVEREFNNNENDIGSNCLTNQQVITFNEHIRKIKIFLYQDLIKEMESGHVDALNWKAIIEAHNWFVEQRHTFPDNIENSFQELFSFLQRDLNAFLDFLRDIAASGKTNDILAKEKAAKMLHSIQSKFTDSYIIIINKINSNNPVEIKSKKSFHIFISKKSSDYQIAKEIYDFLEKNGFSVFLSEESLPNIGGTEYMKEIDEALESSQHLIVMGSSLENITSSWVEAEWRVFINEKRAGRKKGNVITIVTDNLTPKDLPMSLRYYEVMVFNNSTKDKILRYLK